MPLRGLALILLVTTLACGKGNPNNPSGGSGTGSGGSGGGPAGNKGTITATINGASFTGYVPAGASIMTAGIFSIAGASTDFSTTLAFAALAAVGTTTAGGLSPTNAILTVTPGAATWVANVSGGSGTVTIATLTATGATGTFSFTMVPSPGSGATGTRTVTNGSFNVTF